MGTLPSPNLPPPGSGCPAAGSHGGFSPALGTCRPPTLLPKPASSAAPASPGRSGLSPESPHPPGTQGGWDSPEDGDRAVAPCTQSDRAAYCQPPALPPQARTTPTSSHGSRVRKVCHPEPRAFSSLGEVERQVRRNPQFLLIKNPSTVTWEICSESVT